MMTDEQFEAKYQELVRSVLVDLEIEGKRLLHCGGIAATAYEDDYLLPKIILCAALGKEAGQWASGAKSFTAAVRNLSHF